MSYYPSNDQQYNTWLVNFLAALETRVATFGLVAADLVPLQDAQLILSGLIDAHVTAQAAAQAATAVKDAGRQDSEDMLKSLVRQINNHPAMTNQIRAALGLPQRGVSTVSTSSVGMEVPDIYLVAMPGAINVHFGTTPANERTNNKPSWAKGCNIYRRKTGETEFSLIAFETSSPFTDAISGPAADYTYIVRYRGTRAADMGLESTPATIAASGLLAA